MCLVAIPCAFVLGKSAVEFILLISSVLLLPIIELLNSAIEATVDRIGLEYHELSGLAKDLASAAIFVAGINAAITWSVIFYWNVFM